MAYFIYEKEHFHNRNCKNKMNKTCLFHRLFLLWIYVGVEILDNTTHQAPIQKNAFVSVMSINSIPMNERLAFL